MTIQQTSEKIYETLNSPSDISVSSISAWQRDNLGALNNKIYVTFATNDAQTEITGECPSYTILEESIFMKMYDIYYYNKQIRAGLGVGGADIIREINSDGGIVRMVNKNEIAKTYRGIKTDASLELDGLVTKYLINRGEANQVAGDDTISYLNDPNLGYITA